MSRQAGPAVPTTATLATVLPARTAPSPAGLMAQLGSWSRHSRSRWLLGIALGLAGGGLGCTPKIGDQCTLSTDCSTSGDRLCDTSQPSGYCTQFNCVKNKCPDQAACVLFYASVSGCGYDDRAGAFGARTSRSFCVAQCQTNSDCRAGYICADPRTAPWSALILDDDQTQKTCVVPPPEFADAGVDASVETNICSPTGPDVPAIDASAPSAPGADASVLPPLFPDAGTSVADGG